MTHTGKYNHFSFVVIRKVPTKSGGLLDKELVSDMLKWQIYHFFLVNSKPELPKSLVKTVKSNFGQGRGHIKSTYYRKLLEMRRLSNHKLAGLKLNSKQTRAVCWLVLCIWREWYTFLPPYCWWHTLEYHTLLLFKICHLWQILLSYFPYHVSVFKRENTYQRCNPVFLS